MNDNTALPLTRHAMAICAAALAVCITTGITTVRQRAEQARADQIREDIRLIDQAERQLAIR